MTSISDFPLSIPIEGESTSIGVVRMYIDGDVFKIDGEPYVWIVEFVAVED